MLHRQHMPLWMGHYSEHASGHVADAGHVPVRAVRIDRIISRLTLTVHVTHNHLSGLLQAAQGPRLPADEPAFAMCGRHVHAFVSPQEGTVPRGSLEVNPAILKLARSVVRKSRHRTFV